MNKYVIKTIVMPKVEEDPKKYIWYVSPNHFSDDKNNAKRFDTREEAMEVSSQIPFENEIEIA